MMKQWFKSGDPWIWLTASAVSASLILVFGLIALIAVRGLGHFWPADLLEFDYQQKDGRSYKVVAEIHDEEAVSVARLNDAGYQLTSASGLLTRYLVKVGNRELLGSDFQWVVKAHMSNISTPNDLVAIERSEWGNFYGRLNAIKQNGEVVVSGEGVRAELLTRLKNTIQLREDIATIQKGDIGSINYQMERLRLQQRKLQLNGDDTSKNLDVIDKKRDQLQIQYNVYQKQLNDLYQKINRDSLIVISSQQQTLEISLAKIVRVYFPNELDVSGKLGLYLEKMWEFVADEPREANTEGGIFPAIFGTVMMVILMSVFVTPFGVVAAVYLREYAKQGLITRIIRIAVNNLAGVPSIVYGVFGLGFFVYFVGANVDQWFFPEAFPAPTFGTPGILWSSLTLALLTVPVVIVATEEGLSRIPKSLREGSLALGATKAETLWRTVLPMTSPAIMTGLILAVARAAGEVAPLMLVGVVKLAPTLPMDSDFPFLHLERKFMHLGFHIYDVGFQSPNVEAAQPLVYATALLLIVIIVILNIAAIAIRNNLREKYRALEG